MGSAFGSLFANKAKTEELKIQRRDAHRKKSREKIDSDLKAIEAKVEKDALLDPVYSNRPYGLPEGMEGSRADIWDLIFHHVDDLDTIINLREVCKLFRDRLRRNYVQARLPEAVVYCLEKRFIPWIAERTDARTWVKTMLTLRTLCKTTRNSVDWRFDRRGLDKEMPWENWFWARYPHYLNAYWKMPALMLGALDVEQARLERIMKEDISEISEVLTRSLFFNEHVPHGIAIDLPTQRNEFSTLLEKIGGRILTFEYITAESHSSAYRILRKFVAQIPNLEELMIECVGPRVTPTVFDNVDPFPVCPNLKRFAEGPFGFSSHYLREIFKANPQIQGVLLGQTPSMTSEVHKVKNLLDTLPLTSFHCTCTPLVYFIRHRFPWRVTLKTLALWELWTEVTNRPYVYTSSRTLFSFISSCENLKDLFVSSSRIRNTGGYVNLPRLERVFWKLVPEYKSLEFLKPVEDLRYLVLDVSACPDIHEKKELMRFLEEEDVPALFPALRQIDFKTEMNGRYISVWKNGAPCL